MKSECQRLTGDNAQLQNQLKSIKGGGGAEAPAAGGGSTGLDGGAKLRKANKESVAATNGVNGAASGLNGVERTAPLENGAGQAMAAH